jgi:hypothetical protein
MVRRPFIEIIFAIDKKNVLHLRIYFYSKPAIAKEYRALNLPTTFVVQIKRIEIHPQ